MLSGEAKANRTLRVALTLSAGVEVIPLPSSKHAKKIKNILKGDSAGIVLDQLYTSPEKSQRKLTHF
jgi:hypothetical protein